MEWKKMIEGATIVQVRPMTDAEFKREYWDNCPSHPVYVLELDNGCQIFPSCDYEGNGGGALFGSDSKGEMFIVLNKGR